MQKSYISKGIQRIFEIFATARGCWGRAFGWKISSAQVFYFCNGKVKTFARVQHLKFPTFNLYTVPVKMLYLLWYSTDFRNLCLSTNILLAGSWWKVSGAQIWYFCNGKEKILRMYNNWNFPLSTCILRKQKSYTCISKGIQPIFEILTSAGRCWEWAFRWKVSGAQILYFCNGKVNTLRIENIWNFATFNLQHAPAKILFLQRYSTGFRNLCRS